MKSLPLILAASLLGTAALVAQDPSNTTGAVVTSTKTNIYGNGTITEYVPGTTFIVKETDGPMTYRYGKKVVYETRSGKVISTTELPTRVRVGAPVHVYYDMDGNARVINRVVIDEDD